MDDLEVLKDGADVDQMESDSLGDGAWYGTPAGNTIILPVTATPSPIPPDIVDNDLQQNEEVNKEILNTLERINEHLEEQENDNEGQEQESEQDNEDGEGVPEEAEGETDKTLNDIYGQIENIQMSIDTVQEYAMIHYQNSELIQTFILGFVVASFFAFIIFCFLNKVR